MLKKITLSLLLGVFGVLGMSVAVAPPAATSPAATMTVEEAGFPIDPAVAVEDFLNMTPKKYEEMTGKKLTLKEKVVMKLAQKKVKKQMKRAQKDGDEPFPKIVFILGAIFLPIVAIVGMGIMDDWEGNNWWIAALLYFACYIPGVIYTLIKMPEYYD
ncbi:hypothetical protein [Lewinella sp. 4G2]|uniref:hypothetical protein n=1 Tax=Lewinella sp. 4G2 TaxID=1803372 RepID=UPI0007B4733C|nr:hypothetical protein [Lewinella sp. 4G2]OAV45469.1 hypothetical protein A3850_013650 [Lewinella sp. 4G2]